MRSAPKVGMLIMPGEVNDIEGLRKSLLAKVRDPRVAQFDEYRAQGMDSETAAELSGLDELSAEDRAEAILSSVRYNNPSIGTEVVRSTTYEMPAALRNVGAAAGSAAGTAMGMAAVGLMTKHATIIAVGASTVGVAVGMTFAFKFVAKSMGIAWAAAAVANIGSAAAIVGFAFMRAKRK